MVVAELLGVDAPPVLILIVLLLTFNTALDKKQELPWAPQFLELVCRFVNPESDLKLFVFLEDVVHKMARN